MIARLELAGVAISTRICVIVERSGLGDEFERVRPREMNHLFWLIACQVVFGELSAETIIPGNFDERLNWGWSENTFEGPMLSRTTVGIFFDQAVDTGVVVGLCVVVFSVASVFTGDESDKPSVRCKFWENQRDSASIDVDSRG